MANRADEKSQQTMTLTVKRLDQYQQVGAVISLLFPNYYGHSSYLPSSSYNRPNNYLPSPCCNRHSSYFPSIFPSYHRHSKLTWSLYFQILVHIHSLCNLFSVCACVRQCYCSYLNCIKKELPGVKELALVYLYFEITRVVYRVIF